MNLKAKAYLGAVFVCGAAAVYTGISSWHSANAGYFLAMLMLGASTSLFRVSIFGIEGSMSMNFMFVIASTARLSLAETLCVGATATLVQTYWRRKKKNSPLISVFNVALIAAVSGACFAVYHSAPLQSLPWELPRLLIVSITYFILNTSGVAGIITLTTNQTFWSIWRTSYAWSFVYYLLGACAVGVLGVVEHTFGSEAIFLISPIAYMGYQSYKLRIGALEKAWQYAEGRRAHAQQVAELHMRTTRALALAIEAKDTTTGQHLHRVQTYAMAIGRELGLSEDLLQALNAAAILHDIGKIAVPEYIISKPGRLSKEEFDRMKIHPVVGAEIIEGVSFPYPVAPIVKAHHEKWDGTGYPFGLKGEEIPIGARIISAVDCLDALASDRQYRRALPLDKAMDFLRSESAKAFDPRIVEILGRLCHQLEAEARATAKSEIRLSLSPSIDSGATPDAGLETAHLRNGRNSGGRLLDQINNADAEYQTFEAVARAMPRSKSPLDLLHRLATILGRIIPFSGAVLFIRKQDVCTAEYLSGDAVSMLNGLRVQVGSGLSGWVAEHRLPILNGNPATEWAIGQQLPDDFCLRSALSVPLETEDGVLAVLTLYCNERDAFDGRHLRVLMAARSRISFELERALTARSMRASAACEGGLPNGGALLDYLDHILGEHGQIEPFLVIAIRPLASSSSSKVDLVKRIFRNEHPYLARVGGSDLVAVVPLRSTSATSLVSDFARRIHQAQSELGQIQIGWAEAPIEGVDAEQLVSTAASRLSDLLGWLQPETSADRNWVALSSLAARLHEEGQTVENSSQGVGPTLS